jgi:PAS domain S-box-containing protein
MPPTVNTEKETLDELRAELRAYREFEALTAELLSTFVSLPSGKIDDAIETAQRRVCGLLGLELSALWQWTAGTRRYLAMTHYYRPFGGPPVPEVFDADEVQPWSRDQVVANRVFAYTSVDEFPPEAARDRATLEHFGVKSGVNLPLSTGGGPVLGAVSFNTVQAERAWPEGIVRRLQLVAQIFAGALGRKAADEALRESEERLHLAADSAAAGLWSLDLATSSFWVTEQARRQFAFSASETVTLDRVQAAVVPEDRARIAEAIREAAETGREVQVEYRLFEPDGRERWLASRGRIRRGPSGEPDRIMGVTIDVTERKRAEEELRDLSRRLIRAHEEERALLARDLHDDVSQRLAALAIEIGRSERAAPDGAQAESLRAVRRSLAEISEDIHSLSYQLHPSVLEELGLDEALRTECARFRRRSPSPIHLSVDLGPRPAVVGPDAALCLFRVAQEALNNVVRHAGACTVSVTLRKEGDGTCLTVRDDGAGFEPAVQRERRSLGLASMRERVTLVNGKLDVESAPGRGTAIVAWVPDEGEPE